MMLAFEILNAAGEVTPVAQALGVALLCSLAAAAWRAISTRIPAK